VSSVGVASQSRIVSIQVIDSSCVPAGCVYTFSEITAALDYIAAHPGLGVDVVNMSLGTNATFAGNCDRATSWLMAGAAAVNRLRSAGVMIVAASGNDGLTNEMGAPACLSGVLSVAASDTSDTMAPFSNTSATTDLVAPGVGVVSDAIGGGTTTASGTSMASPAVAGCVAALREFRTTGGAGPIEQALESSGTPVTRGARRFPRINCAAALTVLRRPDAPRRVRAKPGPTRKPTGPLVVSFRKGFSDWGSPVTSHTVTCTSPNGGVTKSKVKANTGPLKVTFGGLTTGKSYTCVAKATNAYGTGSASAKSPSVAVGAPAAPTKIGAVRVSSGSIRVSFTPGANNGSPITKYTARCTTIEGDRQSSKASAGSPITVTGLVPARRYGCKVVASNSRGAGPASNRSAAVRA
jgi:hypothetical protein